MGYRPTARISDDTLLKFQALDAKPEKKFKGTPPAKKLSLLLRPAFIARPGKTLLWGDWSAIEARVLPWLAASTGAEKVLDIFRQNDRDSKLPDIYISEAAGLLNEDPIELWAALKDKNSPLHDHAKKVRQSHGKVPVLSLGFGGGLGALQAMAVNYGVYLDDKAALAMVNGWRGRNGWAKSFWGAHGREGSYGLWGAINTALENPDTICPAGRVAYVYDKSYMGGTVFCALPCGRLLTYPKIKWEWREVKDKKTGKIKDVYQLSYLKGYGRSGLWYGKLAENITQATAASILRRTLKRLRYEEVELAGNWRAYEDIMPVVMHTHDEIVAEVDENSVDELKPILLSLMEENDYWDEGLPLKAEIGTNWYYSKSIE